MFKWKEEFTCFNQTIDEQHKNLFEIIDRLYEIATLRDGYDHFDEIVGIFHELKEYTVYHFGYEENLFQTLGYDAVNIKLHKLEHKSFIHKISEIDIHDIDNNQEETSLDIVLFVAKWVQEHIVSTDKKFAEFYKSIPLKENAHV